MKEKDNETTFFQTVHYGKWVALSSDRTKILDYSDDLQSLCKKLGTSNVVYKKPLDPSKQYAFYGVH